MKVTIFSCGPAANESELFAIQHLKSRLQSTQGSDEWILLTNLAYSVTHQLQSDEIDIVAIGPPGVRVIEVKHWSSTWVDSHPDLVEQEADKVTNKARKIGTTLRRIVPHLPRVDGAILLTQEPAKVKRLSGRVVRGVAFHTLNQWSDAIGLKEPKNLSPLEVRSLSRKLEPKSAVAVDGSLRRLAGYINLELQTTKDERFHRVYKGSHPSRRDRVILHLYDLSADLSGDETNPEVKARREAETLQRLQLYSWAPRILDSWQDAPGYAGEMYFFTVVDPATPCLEDRTTDEKWPVANRMQFARESIRALAELHQSGSRSGQPEELLVHRNLTPKNLLVRHNNYPILTGFNRTRIPSDISIAPKALPESKYPKTIAPEVQKHGLAAADQRSDVYSLCACLTTLFDRNSDGLSKRAIDCLSGGLIEDPVSRSNLADLERSFSELMGDSVPPSPVPPARYWTEDQIVRFHEHDYRIVNYIGSGGIGRTFKVVEIDRLTKEELGTYVAKVAHEQDAGECVLKSYSLVRSHLGRHEALTPIFEVAREWKENQFISLLGWIEGTPLSDFTGIFPLLAEDQGEPAAEDLAIRWLQLLCESLDVLHRNGLTHGDVSPKNMIVSGPTLVLTDYDFVTRIGEDPPSAGTINYCSPERQQRKSASPADDQYALAASFYHVLFDQEPFRYEGELAKERGLNWDGVDRNNYPFVALILDRATTPDPAKRFESALDMLSALRRSPKADKADIVEDHAIPTGSQTDPRGSLVPEELPRLREQRIVWLKSLLQSYPGSPRWGNRETRGLDSDFASDTYVPTKLEHSLLEDIRAGQVQLVILCGNAGDGKTALLQHLAQQLELGRHLSSNRILEGLVPGGPSIRMNLDGSAAWNGKSADEILDEFLEPFHNGPPDNNIVHLLAVNDGRLLEWVEGAEDRIGVETPLIRALLELLQQESINRHSHIRFISLNQRSLVGGITPDRNGIDTTFLEQLLDHLYGGTRAGETWSPCKSCLAKDRCHVFQAVQVFGPPAIESPFPDDVRRRARSRLFEALQAVHLRGETHITVRELRAALVYILFGVHHCDDYHNGTVETVAYWDRAFAADSPARQGDVLRELTRFDPALEAHPQIDRYLTSRPANDGRQLAPHFKDLSIDSARRRAFFEWTSENIKSIASDPEALGLARGRHLQLFRDLSLNQDPEKLAWVTQQLCAGISRLEDLPPQALDRPGVVPLRITPRTPTETAFWVEKPLETFRIESVLPPETEGIDRLHRHVSLIYHYRDGNEEYLRLGAELFHLLLELAEGYQLGDASTDDTFANLSVFVQRLVREDERELLAWNPMQDERIYKVATKLAQISEKSQQHIEINQILAGADS